MKIMTKLSFFICKVAGAILCASFLTSCLTTTKNKGYKIDQEDIASIKINVSTKQDVLNKLGTPSSRSQIGPDIWYYIYMQNKAWAFLKPKQTDIKVVAIKMNQSDHVIAIEQMDGDKAPDIALQKDYTLTHGDDKSAYKQFFGDIGRYSKKKVAKRTASDPTLPY
jgi:outer membrane protein assembly factor BamE (lipoprotein component of BamABCDE complex)